MTKVTNEFADSFSDGTTEVAAGDLAYPMAANMEVDLPDGASIGDDPNARLLPKTDTDVGFGEDITVQDTEDVALQQGLGAVLTSRRVQTVAVETTSDLNVAAGADETGPKDKNDGGAHEAISAAIESLPAVTEVVHIGDRGPSEVSLEHSAERTRAIELAPPPVSVEDGTPDLRDHDAATAKAMVVSTIQSLFADQPGAVNNRRTRRVAITNGAYIGAKINITEYTLEYPQDDHGGDADDAATRQTTAYRIRAAHTGDVRHNWAFYKPSEVSPQDLSWLRQRLDSPPQEVVSSDTDNDDVEVNKGHIHKQLLQHPADDPELVAAFRALEWQRLIDVENVKRKQLSDAIETINPEIRASCGPRAPGLAHVGYVLPESTTEQEELREIYETAYDIDLNMLKVTGVASDDPQEVVRSIRNAHAIVFEQIKDLVDDSAYEVPVALMDAFAAGLGLGTAAHYITMDAQSEQLLERTEAGWPRKFYQLLKRPGGDIMGRHVSLMDIAAVRQANLYDTPSARAFAAAHEYIGHGSDPQMNAYIRFNDGTLFVWNKSRDASERVTHPRCNFLAANFMAIELPEEVQAQSERTLRHWPYIPAKYGGGVGLRHGRPRGVANLEAAVDWEILGTNKEALRALLHGMKSRIKDTVIETFPQIPELYSQLEDPELRRLPDETRDKLLSGIFNISHPINDTTRRLLIKMASRETESVLKGIIAEHAAVKA